MSWHVEFLKEANDEFQSLTLPVRRQVAKGIEKVRQNPLPKAKGGYGEPLGNRGGTALAGLYKIKYKQIGIRVVYALKTVDETMTVVVVSMRADNEVYKIAHHRRGKHDV